jgi:hypothetical protein
VGGQFGGGVDLSNTAAAKAAALAKAVAKATAYKGKGGAFASAPKGAKSGATGATALAAAAVAAAEVGGTELQLVWRKNPPKKSSVDMMPCTSVHRVSPLDVCLRYIR